MRAIDSEPLSAGAWFTVRYLPWRPSHARPEESPGPVEAALLVLLTGLVAGMSGLAQQLAAAATGHG
jgi:hypothetical protein